MELLVIIIPLYCNIVKVRKKDKLQVGGTADFLSAEEPPFAIRVLCQGMSYNDIIIGHSLTARGSLPAFYITLLCKLRLLNISYLRGEGGRMALCLAFGGLPPRYLRVRCVVAEHRKDFLYSIPFYSGFYFVFLGLGLKR